MQFLRPDDHNFFNPADIHHVEDTSDTAGEPSCRIEWRSDKPDLTLDGESAAYMLTWLRVRSTSREDLRSTVESFSRAAVDGHPSIMDASAQTGKDPAFFDQVGNGAQSVAADAGGNERKKSKEGVPA